MNVDSIPDKYFELLYIHYFLTKPSFKYPALLFTLYRIPWTELILKRIPF